MKALITGGAGFIGHHVVDYLLKNTGWELTILDRLDGSGNQMRLMELDDWYYSWSKGRVKFCFHDLRAPFSDQVSAQIGEHEIVLHLAAATHVDHSIRDPLSFVMDNVVSTCNLLDHVRKVGCDKMIYFSTDEVFGPAIYGTAHAEWDRYRSGNPYAATKAGAEELCVAYQNTYRVPVIITHCMNVFGERQHPDKFIPGTIARVSRGEKVLIHSNAARTKAGSRFYIHAQSVAEALLFLLEQGFVPGDKYNIVGEREVDNLELATMIANYVGKKLIYEMVDFHSSRPGHDLRYALDGRKMAAMGWGPTAGLEERLQSVVTWTLNNPHWQLGLRSAAE